MNQKLSATPKKRIGAPWTCLIGVLLTLHFLIACVFWGLAAIGFAYRGWDVEASHFYPAAIGVVFLMLSVAVVVASMRWPRVAPRLLVGVLVLAVIVFWVETRDINDAQLHYTQWTDEGLRHRFVWTNWWLFVAK